VGLLGVGATVVDVRIREAGTPHHDATKRGIAFIFPDEFCELGRRDVVSLSGCATISS
jgi:hypothetical protein